MKMSSEIIDWSAESIGRPAGHGCRPNIGGGGNNRPQKLNDYPVQVAQRKRNHLHHDPRNGSAFKKENTTKQAWWKIEGLIKLH